MDESVLEEGLLELDPTIITIQAISAFVKAYEVYAADASATAPMQDGLPLLPAGLALGVAAMEGVMSALPLISGPNEALTRIPQAVIAFWTAIAGGLATSFAGATAIVPPPHATFQVDFATLMAANTAASVSKEDAAASLATLMHINATLGGTVSVGPTVYTIV